MLLQFCLGSPQAAQEPIVLTVSAECCLSQDGSEPAAKRQKVDGADEDGKAHARAKAFLKDFAAIPLASLDPEAALQQAKALYTQLQQDANSMPALHRLLAVSTG